MTDKLKLAEFAAVKTAIEDSARGREYALKHVAALLVDTVDKVKHDCTGGNYTGDEREVLQTQLLGDLEELETACATMRETVKEATKVIPRDKQCVCGNCSNVVSSDDVDIGDCQDLSDRLDPGSEVPAGDCPKCRAFVYLVQNPGHKRRAELMLRAAKTLEEYRYEHKELIKDLRENAAEHYPTA